jgi:hyaluronoglucosaminidase
VGNASTLLIAITLNGQTAYVANVGPQQRGTVTPIATATNKAGRAIPVGRNPAAIAITPNGRTACVANALSDTVTPIATATSKAGNAIPAGQDPTSIAITP